MNLPPFTPSENYFFDEFQPPSDYDFRPPPTPDDIMRTHRAIRTEDLRTPVKMYQPRAEFFHVEKTETLRPQRSTFRRFALRQKRAAAH